ncbi:hypothetical protein KJ756_00040, partial [Patescibacteria group bacterium]|nr:hypothetical protein [Patescibacteria group bacterium]
MKKITANNINWIDIQNPKQKDLDELKEKFNLHPFIVQQFLPNLRRPKIEEYPEQLFLVLYFPVYDPETRQTEPVELDLIVVGDTLITSHNE